MVRGNAVRDWFGFLEVHLNCCERWWESDQKTCIRAHTFTVLHTKMRVLWLCLFALPTISSVYEKNQLIALYENSSWTAWLLSQLHGFQANMKCGGGSWLPYSELTHLNGCLFMLDSAEAFIGIQLHTLLVLFHLGLCSHLGKATIYGYVFHALIKSVSYKPSGGFSGELTFLYNLLFLVILHVL